MRSTVANGILTVATACLGLATLIGLLAPWWPITEMPNHFRPFLLAASMVALLVAVVLRLPRLRIASGAVTALNALLFGIPLLWSAEAAHSATAANFKVVSFNIWSKNTRLDEVGSWLDRSGADIIVLQEMTARSRPVLIPKLQQAYQYIYDCGCNDIVIFSKHRWIDAGGQPRTEATPSLSWITLRGPGGTLLRFIGLRPIYPNRPDMQAAHYRWLQTNLAPHHGTMILAGDFNVTPWSWKLNRLLHTKNLARHGTLTMSFPGNSSPSPFVLIDNVVTTRDIKAVTFEAGPYLGSDHLPIVAALALP